MNQEEPVRPSLDDDIRAHVFAALDAGSPFALATIVAAEGGPRPVGSQMVITTKDAWGFLSGGCVEADVALHGREVLAGKPARTLIYGRGSPFIDMRLPCGGRIEVLVERVSGDDPAMRRLRALTGARAVAILESDGRHRRCRSARDDGLDLPGAVMRRTYLPIQRLVVIGSDPFALAIAHMGATIGWQTVVLSPFGKANAGAGLNCDTRPVRRALGELVPDPWTAVAVATHEQDSDAEALVPALRSRAGYVGVLGARRRIPERLAGLREAGLTDAEIACLKAPIGLAIGAQAPWEVAVAVIAGIIDDRQLREAAALRLSPGRSIAGAG
jgi:xanthine dehydrogenase accessory factor